MRLTCGNMITLKTPVRLLILLTLIRWWYEAPMGHVRSRERSQYCTPVVHSFTNTANRQEVLTLGTTHVAVGFVDLGLLQWATLNAGVEAQAERPLQFVGLEMCAFNVAKTLVIARMLDADSGASPRDILQVWYSSTWSDSAHHCFRCALTSILERSHEPGSPHGVTPEVRAYLLEWQRHDVTVATARREWIKSYWDSGVGNWKRRADRIALCRYRPQHDTPDNSSKIASPLQVSHLRRPGWWRPPRLHYVFPPAGRHGVARTGRERPHHSELGYPDATAHPGRARVERRGGGHDRWNRHRAPGGGGHEVGGARPLWAPRHRLPAARNCGALRTCSA